MDLRRKAGSRQCRAMKKSGGMKPKSDSKRDIRWEYSDHASWKVSVNFMWEGMGRENGKVCVLLWF